MRLKSKFIRLIVIVLFVAYILLLVKFILLKHIYVFSFFWERDRAGFGVNFIPFRTIINLIQGFGLFDWITFYNIIGNIMLFSPLGFFIPMLFDRYKKPLSIISVSSITSVTFEVIQYITNLGAFDIDDIILNSLGGLLGYMVFSLLGKVINKCRENKKVKSQPSIDL